MCFDKIPDDGKYKISKLTDKIFNGKTACLKQGFTIGIPDEETICCQRLTEPAVLSGILDRFISACFPQSDKKAAASYWSQWYFGRLIPPLLVMAQQADSNILAGMSHLYMSLDPKGRPHHFTLATQETIAATGNQLPLERLAPLIKDHLAPLIFSFSARSGASARIFWMNAAIAIDYTCDLLLDKEGQALKAATLCPTQADGTRNPLCNPYRPSGSELTRSRRLCCLRYLLENEERCSDCALKPATGKTARPLIPGFPTENTC